VFEFIRGKIELCERMDILVRQIFLKLIIFECCIGHRIENVFMQKNADFPLIGSRKIWHLVKRKWRTGKVGGLTEEKG
jgi:hypothetical protein